LAGPCADGWMSIPVLISIPTVGSRADGVPPSPTARAALVTECVRENERKASCRKTYGLIVLKMINATRRTIID